MTEEFDIKKDSLVAAAEAIRSKKISSTQLIEKAIERLRDTENNLHAYAYINEDSALAKAAAADREISEHGPRSPLHGIPVGIKDLFATKDMPTEAGSRVLRGHQPQCDAWVVKSLRDNGAIFIGKQQTHEFGLGMNVPPTRTPWGQNSYPGGSTVGGAVSTVVGSCLAAFGTDGGGSIRKPASINGLVGLKPSLGRISTRGIEPGGTSVDHVGWITRTVEDAALIYAVLANERLELKTGHMKLRLGCVSQCFQELDPQIELVIHTALDALKANGAEVVWFNVPEFKAALHAHGVIAMAESYQFHASFMQLKSKHYYPASLRCLNAGADITVRELHEAHKTRKQLTAAIESLFIERGVDALCSPTVPITPVLLSDMEPDRLLGRYTSLTCPFNLSGNPAISVPCGMDKQGFPVGFQIATRLHDEAMAFRVAQALAGLNLWNPGILEDRFLL